MLHYNTVSQDLLKVIQLVSADPFFSDFRLVGGTALSLYPGHRVSVDADFFTDKEFDTQAVIDLLSELSSNFTVINRSKFGITTIFDGIKLDLYVWRTPFRHPIYQEVGIRMASIEDIAALKLEAAVRRKTEKDFRDVHALMELYPMERLSELYHYRHPSESKRVLMDHLIAVRHAERDHSVVLLKEIQWEKVCQDIIETVESYLEEGQTLKKKKEIARINQLLDILKNKQKK